MSTWVTVNYQGNGLILRFNRKQHICAEMLLLKCAIGPSTKNAFISRETIQIFLLRTALGAYVAHNYVLQSICGHLSDD